MANHNTYNDDIHIPAYKVQSDTFTATGNGTTIDRSDGPLKYFSVSVTSTGTTATLWTVILEAGLDGVNFTTLLTHTQAILNGVTMSLTTPGPYTYFRVRCSVLTLGSATNIIARTVASA